MSNYFEYHPSYQKQLKDKEKIFKGEYLKYKKDLNDYLNRFYDAKILEIGCWIGKFSYFCDKIWVKDYTWIDIDDYFFEYNKKDFPNYNFLKIWFQEYLKEHKNEFDIIFVSHVFEHLDEKERMEMITGVYGWLREWWIRINYMPNWDNFLRFGMCRYWDLTHKSIYTNISFNQLVKSSNLPFEIENFNIYIWVKNKFRRIIHLIFRFFTKIYFLGMWESFPEFYTWEFINLLTKKWKN